MRTIALFINLLLVPVLLAAQDWHPPVDPPIRLSGSFGELRSSHFHAGIDIKSKNGVVGDPLYAVEEGFISRIAVDASGYGNVLYIDHPSGYTSVYGHMQSFKAEIEEWVREKQYELQSFELDIKPDPSLFPVERGEQIGQMGTSGYSFGPHVHFELRHTQTERTQSPVLMGVDIEDDIPPYLKRLYLYGMDESGQLLDRKEYSLRKGNNWRLSSGEALAEHRFCGFGIEVYDRMNATPNRNDIYSLQLFVDDSLVYGINFDSLSFREKRYILAHQDYEMRTKYRRKVHRLYRLPGNYHSAYSKPPGSGMIQPDSGKSHDIRIVAEDHAGNRSILEFELKTAGELAVPRPASGYLLLYDQPNWVCFEGVEIRLPDSALYHNTYIEAGLMQDYSQGVIADVVQIGQPDIPLHKPFEIYMFAPDIPQKYRKKTAMVNCSGSRPRLYPGHWIGDIFVSETIEFGSYSLMLDTVPPQIVPLSAPGWARYGSNFRFRIRDNFSHDLGSDALTFEGRVDGKWVLVEYDYKNGLIHYKIDSRIQPGRHEFVLWVEDPLGNRATYSKSFTLSD